MTDEPPLRRARQDPHLWGKVLALWHRERMREAFVGAGFSTLDARKRANDEALAVARSHGFRGGLHELKAAFDQLLDHRRQGIDRRERGRARYWEDDVDAAMVHLLAAQPEELRAGLREFLLEEAGARGPFTGKVGLYKLAYILGFVPPFERLAWRNAFIAALSEIGHHADCCEPGLFNVVLRLSRPYTLRRLDRGLGTAKTDKPPGRWMPSWMRSHE